MKHEKLIRWSVFCISTIALAVLNDIAQLPLWWCVVCGAVWGIVSAFDLFNVR